MIPIENFIIKLNLDKILCINKNHIIEKIFMREKPIKYITLSNLQFIPGDLDFMHREKSARIGLKMSIEAPM